MFIVQFLNICVCRFGNHDCTRGDSLLHLNQPSDECCTLHDALHAPVSQSVNAEHAGFVEVQKSFHLLCSIFTVCTYQGHLLTYSDPLIPTLLPKFKIIFHSLIPLLLRIRTIQTTVEDSHSRLPQQHPTSSSSLHLSEGKKPTEIGLTKTIMGQLHLRFGCAVCVCISLSKTFSM
jgi:hypothetical protein